MSKGRLPLRPGITTIKARSTPAEPVSEPATATAKSLAAVAPSKRLIQNVKQLTANRQKFQSTQNLFTSGGGGGDDTVVAPAVEKSALGSEISPRGLKMPSQGIPSESPRSLANFGALLRARPPKELALTAPLRALQPSSSSAFSGASLPAPVPGSRGAVPLGVVLPHRRQLHSLASTPTAAVVIAASSGASFGGCIFLWVLVCPFLSQPSFCGVLCLHYDCRLCGSSFVGAPFSKGLSNRIDSWSLCSGRLIDWSSFRISTWSLDRSIVRLIDNLVEWALDRSIDWGLSRSGAWARHGRLWYRLLTWRFIFFESMYTSCIICAL